MLKAGERDKRFKHAKNFPFDLHFIYPIKELTTEEVFSELEERKIPLNPLYSMGFKRVGCFPCFLQKKEVLKVLELAIKGDPFAIERVEIMEQLDRAVLGRFHVDLTFQQFKRIAEMKSKQLSLPLEAVHE